LTLLSFVADHLAMVVENHRLYQVAQQSAVLEERSRLARELHDSVTQSLYSANMYTAGAQRFATQGKFAEVEAYLHEIGQLTQQALKDLRLMIYELRSAEVAQHGLMAALENRLDAVERRSGIAAEIVVADSVVLPGVVEENLYRTAIEALNNALKYAQARQVRLEFKQVEDDLIFSISDTGAGFDVEAGLANGGVGLASMRERAETLGGQFEVTSCPGNGTRVEVRIPLGRGAGQGVRGDD
jgi:signal transduction histidine kinase